MNPEHPDLRSSIATLLTLPWRVTGLSKGNGGSAPCDPSTGMSYAIEVEWTDGTELSFGVTRDHYKWAEKNFRDDEEYSRTSLPEWLVGLLNQGPDEE